MQRELAAISAEQARNVQKALSGSGSAAQADTFFQEWKQSAQLAHELNEINERLAGVYAAATGAAPASGKEHTVEVAQGLGECGRCHVSEQPRVGNNAKRLSFLEALLNGETHVGMTQSQMADGATIPLRSVAYSVGRLISMKLIEEGPVRCGYKLL